MRRVTLGAGYRVCVHCRRVVDVRQLTRHYLSGDCAHHAARSRTSADAAQPDTSQPYFLDALQDE